jgi:lysozyme family protein
MATGPDATLFNLACGVGPGRAIMLLQQTVGAKQDGVFGPITMVAVSRHDPDALIDEMTASARAYFATRPTAAEFLNGWDRRADDCAVFAHQLRAGTVSA